MPATCPQSRPPPGHVTYLYRSVCNLPALPYLGLTVWSFLGLYHVPRAQAELGGLTAMSAHLFFSASLLLDTCSIGSEFHTSGRTSPSPLQHADAALMDFLQFTGQSNHLHKTKSMCSLNSDRNRKHWTHPLDLGLWPTSIAEPITGFLSPVTNSSPRNSWPSLPEILSHPLEFRLSLSFLYRLSLPAMACVCMLSPGNGTTRRCSFVGMGVSVWAWALWAYS